MSCLYEWRPQMPNILDIKCPLCKGKAKFYFATIKELKSAGDVEFFKNTPLFEYICKPTGGKHFHAAIYHHGLHGDPHQSLPELPDGYNDSWCYSKGRHYSLVENYGSYVCPKCYQKAAYNLSWPEDAWYAADIKGNTLWAFTREMAIELLDFISSKDRNKKSYKFGFYFFFLPGKFLQRSYQKVIVKKLQILLSGIE